MCTEDGELSGSIVQRLIPCCGQLLSITKSSCKAGSTYFYALPECGWGESNLSVLHTAGEREEKLGETKDQVHISLFESALCGYPTEMRIVLNYLPILGIPFNRSWCQSAPALIHFAKDQWICLNTSVLVFYSSNICPICATCITFIVSLKMAINPGLPSGCLVKGA